MDDGFPRIAQRLGNLHQVRGCPLVGGGHRRPDHIHLRQRVLDADQPANVLPGGGPMFPRIQVKYIDRGPATHKAGPVGQGLQSALSPVVEFYIFGKRCQSFSEQFPGEADHLRFVVDQEPGLLKPGQNGLLRYAEPYLEQNFNGFFMDEIGDGRRLICWWHTDP